MSPIARLLMTRRTDAGMDNQADAKGFVVRLILGLSVLWAVCEFLYETRAVY